MSKLRFSPEARGDLTEIGDYIAFKLRNKAAARSLLSRIQESAMSLTQFPKSGTPLPIPGRATAYRYLVCGNYLIFYHLSKDDVLIDRVLYGRRDYLSILFGDELTEYFETL